MTPIRQYATFLVDGHHVAVAVLDVQEVLRAQRLTRVPLAHEAVEGAIEFMAAGAALAAAGEVFA